MGCPRHEQQLYGDLQHSLRQVSIEQLLLDVARSILLEIARCPLFFRLGCVSGDSGEMRFAQFSIDEYLQFCVLSSPIRFGRCTVRHDCSVSGVRRPSSCAYVKDLLKDIEDLEMNSQEEESSSGPICDSLLDY